MTVGHGTACCVTCDRHMLSAGAFIPCAFSRRFHPLCFQPVLSSPVLSAGESGTCDSVTWHSLLCDSVTCDRHVLSVTYASLRSNQVTV